MPNHLENYTCEELMNELVSRPTWVGLILHSLNEAKPPITTFHNQFALCFNSELISFNQLRSLLEDLTSKIGDIPSY